MTVVPNLHRVLAVIETLAAGTNTGAIMFWKFSAMPAASASSKKLTGVAASMDQDDIAARWHAEPSTCLKVLNCAHLVDLNML